MTQVTYGASIYTFVELLHPQEQERHHNYYVYVCNSKSQYITLGILYGYKGVLQVASLVFAFLIRKIQVKGLNNAMYIVGAIYVTSIMLLIAILSTYLPALAGHHINYFAALFGLGLLVGATVILLLVFVPKVSLCQLALVNWFTTYSIIFNTVAGTLTTSMAVLGSQ